MIGQDEKEFPGRGQTERDGLRRKLIGPKEKGMSEHVRNRNSIIYTCCTVPQHFSSQATLVLWHHVAHCFSNIW